MSMAVELPPCPRPKRPGWPRIVVFGGLMVLVAAGAIVLALQLVSLPLVKPSLQSEGEGCVIGVTNDGRTVPTLGKQDDIARKGITWVVGNYDVLVEISFESIVQVGGEQVPLVERRTTVIEYYEWVPPRGPVRESLRRPRPGPAIDEEVAKCFEENGKQWLADAIRNEPFEKRIVWANVWWLAREYRWHLAGGAVALYGCIVLCRLWRAWYRRRTGRCVHCAYPIGTTLPICPECGLENGGESGPLAGGSTRPGA